MLHRAPGIAPGHDQARLHAGGPTDGAPGSSTATALLTVRTRPGWSPDVWWLGLESGFGVAPKQAMAEVVDVGREVTPTRASSGLIAQSLPVAPVTVHVLQLDGE